jgi:hypothetical protein
MPHALANQDSIKTTTPAQPAQPSAPLVQLDQFATHVPIQTEILTTIAAASLDIMILVLLYVKSAIQAALPAQISLLALLAMQDSSESLAIIFVFAKTDSLSSSTPMELRLVNHALLNV